MAGDLGQGQVEPLLALLAVDAEAFAVGVATPSSMARLAARSPSRASGNRAGPGRDSSDHAFSS